MHKGGQNLNCNIIDKKLRNIFDYYVNIKMSVYIYIYIIICLNIITY